MNDRWSIMTFPHCMDGWMAGWLDGWIDGLMDWMWRFVMNRITDETNFSAKKSSSVFFGKHSGKQLIFGQLLATPGCGLHPLHWVEVMGTANGTPRHLEILDRWVGGSNRLGSLRCEIVWRLGPGKVRRLWSRPVVNVALKNVRRYAEIQRGEI